MNTLKLWLVALGYGGLIFLLSVAAQHICAFMGG